MNEISSLFIFSLLEAAEMTEGGKRLSIKEIMLNEYVYHLVKFFQFNWVNMLWVPFSCCSLQTARETKKKRPIVSLESGAFSEEHGEVCLGITRTIEFDELLREIIQIVVSLQTVIEVFAG